MVADQCQPSEVKGITPASALPSLPARPPDQDESDVQLGALAFCYGFPHDHLTTRTLKNLVVGGLVWLGPNVPHWRSALRAKQTTIGLFQ